jgi:hypothetical protein
MSVAEPIENGNHHQIWQCYCGKRRAWGNTRPEDPEREVFLHCKDCRKVQPHGYLRMKHHPVRVANTEGE